MLDLNGILIGSEDPARLVEFYTKILGPPDWSGDQDKFVGWQVGSGFFGIGPHTDVKGPNQSPGRILYNFETDDVTGEFERLKGLGAKIVAEPYHPSEEPEMWVATFADPDNNYFQLATPVPQLRS